MRIHVRPLLEFLGERHICSAGAAEPVEWSPGAAGGHGCLSWREGSAKNVVLGEVELQPNSGGALEKEGHCHIYPSWGEGVGLLYLFPS